MGMGSVEGKLKAQETHLEVWESVIPGVWSAGGVRKEEKRKFDVRSGYRAAGR